MQGRQMIQAALSPEGAADIPVVIPYEGIMVRDHWEQLTGEPWWAIYSPDVGQQMAWRRDVVRALGQDWYDLPQGQGRSLRAEQTIEVEGDTATLVNRRTGARRALERPQVAGWTATDGPESIQPGRLPESTEEIDALFPPRRGAIVDEGAGDLAAACLDEFAHLYPMQHVPSPLWTTYNLWGYEGMMMLVADRPDLVRHACERMLERCIDRVRLVAALGTAGVWVEDCMTDGISPQAFRALNVAYLRPLIDEIHAAGMTAIHYYCGDPAGKWDLLLDTGADALSLEETKKGFAIDIADVVQRVAGRCALLGNLDAIGVLQDGDEALLRGEIARQMAAGRANGRRFIMSLGSPVTPGTRVERVRLYCEMAHDLGGASARCDTS